MNRTKISVVSLTMAAGLACTAMANDLTGPNLTPAATVAAKPGVAMGQPVVVRPKAVFVDGKPVAFNVVSDPTVLDGVARVSYDAFNGGAGAVNPFTVPTLQTQTAAILEDVTFGNGTGGREIYSARFTLALSDAINPTASFFVRFQWRTDFNANNTPVSDPNSTQGRDLSIQFEPPATGWTPGTVVATEWVTAATTDQGFFSVNASGATELNIVDDIFVANPLPFTDAAVGVSSIPPSIGSSNNRIYLNNNDVTTGVYNPSGSFQLPGGTAYLGVAFLANDPPAAPYGACCMPRYPGGCAILTQAVCTAQGGTFAGAGTNCNSIRTSCYGAGVLWNNGPLSTGTRLYLNAGAPALNPGESWSESTVEPQAGGAVCAWDFSGYLHQNPAFWPADRFTVPSGETWTVDSLRLWAWRTGDPDSQPPIDGVAFEIRRGPVDTLNPGTVVAGQNLITNPNPTWIVASTNPTAGQARLTGTGVYKHPSTPAFSPITKNRRLWEVDVPVSPAVTLPAGDYVLARRYRRSFDTNPTGAPIVAVMTNANGETNPPVGGTWDNGNTTSMIFQPITNPTTTVLGFWYNLYIEPVVAQAVRGTCPAYPTSLPFQVRGQAAGGCYPNCDGSTGTPLLTPADFVCFLNRFRAGDSYANCDGSTGTPTLTPADFVCFLNRFRAGC